MTLSLACVNPLIETCVEEIRPSDAALLPSSFRQRQPFPARRRGEYDSLLLARYASVHGPRHRNARPTRIAVPKRRKPRDSHLHSSTCFTADVPGDKTRETAGLEFRAGGTRLLYCSWPPPRSPGHETHNKIGDGIWRQVYLLMAECSRSCAFKGDKLSVHRFPARFRKRKYAFTSLTDMAFRSAFRSRCSLPLQTRSTLC